MTTVQDIVDTLVELDATDRSWIMAQLTPAQRQRLATQLNDDERAGAAALAGSRAAPLSVVPERTADAPVPIVSARETAAPARAQVRPAGMPESAARQPDAQSSFDSDLACLSKASASQVADIVRREPAWVVQTLLSGQARERSHDVLAHLPPSTRSEVARVAAAETALTPAVRRFLVRAAAARLQGTESALRASRFDRLVDTMRGRLQRIARRRS